MLTRVIAVSLLITVLSVNAQNIQYNVIASPVSTEQSVVVIVDNTSWPLTVTSGILYQGEAPIAKTGYSYAIIDNTDNQKSIIEEFNRIPINEDTVNEFFNRTLNEYQVQSLPQVLSPLPSINRVKSDLHIEGHIPSIHIWGNETAINYLHENQQQSINVKLNFTYIGLRDVYDFENVKVSLAGRSSRWIPKLSYTLKIKKKSKDNLFGYRKFKLRAFGYDYSYIREYIAYSTMHSVGLASSGFSYVRLFINNEPVGFYGLIETFQDPWLANEFADGDKKYKPGYLYQGLTSNISKPSPIISNLKYYTNISYYNHGEYKIKAGPSKKSKNDYTKLQEFTKFIFDADSNTDVQEWENNLDCNGFIRSMALENLLGYSDGYMTVANNYYLYSNPALSGQMLYISADLDSTLGNSFFNMTLMLSGDYTQHPGLTFQPLTKKFFSYEVFSTDYQHMLLNLTKNLINPTIMGPFIDSIVDMIRPDVEWDQTLMRLGEMSRPTFANITESSLNITLILNEFPPGLLLSNRTDVPQTFDAAVNGPINSERIESVKGFIAKKSASIMAFYNK